MLIKCVLCKFWGFSSVLNFYLFYAHADFYFRLLTLFGCNVAETDHCFDEKRTTWGIPIPERIPICKLQTELYQSEHVVKGDFKIIAEVDVFEAVGTLTESDISGKASELLTKKIRNDGNESGDLLKKTSPEKESNHGSHALPRARARQGARGLD